MTAVRLLHTSDWHLGAALGRIDRERDHVCALDSLVELATDTAPDVIVHTGDLFDSARPAASSQKLAVETLRRLSAIAPVVVIAGNHDNGPMLHTVWQPLVDLGTAGDRIHIRGLLRHPDQGGVVTVPRRDGTGSIFVCCTPYISVHAYAVWAGGRAEPAAAEPGASPGGRTVSPTEAYSDGLARVARAYDGWLSAHMDPATDIAVSAAHVLVSGAQPGGSERKVHEADDFATAVGQLTRVAYAAFGHIHRPQAVPGGRVPGHYAGSLIPVDYGEGHEVKSTVLVEFGAGGVATPRQIPHHSGRPLVEVRGTLADIAAQSETCQGAIVKATVLTETPTPGLATRVAEVLGGGAWLFGVREERRGTLARADARRHQPAGMDALLEAWLRDHPVATPRPRRAARLVSALVEAAMSDTPVRFTSEPELEGADGAVEGDVRVVDLEDAPTSEHDEAGRLAL